MVGGLGLRLVAAAPPPANASLVSTMIPVKPIDLSDRVCVVGAGSSGLAAAKNLREHGMQVDVLEREADLGGNWNYGSPAARVYRSTHMISSKRFTQYPDFPMPAEFPDYPHHAQVLAYLRSYAEQFELLDCIQFGTGVVRIEPVDSEPAENGAAHPPAAEHRNGRPYASRRPRWLVTASDGSRRIYGAVVIANGHHRCPKWPRWHGSFRGEMLHSAHYKTPETFQGRRVLVVGAGNSGCDIAVEAAQNAEATFHSFRRGYYFIPKYLLGVPADQGGDFLHWLRLPLWLRRRLTQMLLRLSVGRPDQYGLPKPDHRLFETHPIVNTLLLYYVRHGDITPKPDIARLDGDWVHFVDGTREKIDVIVCATGYHLVFPFIDHRWLNWHDGRPRLYRHVFHPHCDSLFVAGMIQPDSGIFSLVHWQTQAIGLFLKSLDEGTQAAPMLQRLKATEATAEDLGAGIRYTQSERHSIEVEHWSYMKRMKELVRQLRAASEKVIPA